MLLTDGRPNNIEDLRVYGSSILDLASTEKIELDAKLDLALTEIKEDVLDVLLDHTRSSDPQSTIRRTIGVSDVVITPQMKRWHAVHTLEVVYRDAFNNQLNNRYQAQFEQYHELSKNAREHTLRFGIGMALLPIPIAQPPLFSYVAGLIPATTYYVRVSWVGTGGKEGMPSCETTYDAPAGSLPVITAVHPPPVAAGFNVYMSLAAGCERLQNAAPIPLGSSFTLPGTGLVNGTVVGNGQIPDTYVIGGRTLRRG
ncbi:MAG: hypothetical protein JO307_25390 [Bryobacterales bacterium]|nr:hypothetical protein [Bryobacterales bacterium]MBV9397572.1 hypothetical protein [Bryobacterales bacterium]